MSRRILAIRPGAIGDSILGLPALEHLANQGELEIWARSEILPLVAFAPTAAIASTGIDTLGVTSPTPHLRERLARFDTVHTWYGYQREDFREALTALHPDVHFHPALPSGDSQHAADFFAGHVQAPVPAIPKLHFAPTRNRMIWIHPFSGSARKNWPLDHYQTLARWLEATGRSVQFCTSPVQPLPAARVIENLAELASWLAGASLYIGNDSGITHLAAASGAPTVALFGPTNPQVWAPRGSNVTIIQSDLDTLSIEHVLNHAMDR